MSSVDGNGCYGDKNAESNMINLQAQIQAAISYVSCLGPEEDVIILIGLSKAGKTSLANFLTGVQLTGTKNARYEPITLQNVYKDHGAVIPVVPRRCCSDKFIIWDMPGIDDNQNEFQDIINAIYISELLKKVKSAKILLAVDMENIRAQNVKLILTLLTAVENLFNDRLRESFSAISMIITKVDSDIQKIPVTKTLITDMIFEKLLSQRSPKISEVTKALLSHLIENHKKIGLFKRPTEIGSIISNAIGDGIIEAIESTESIRKEILEQITPSISGTSQVLLYKMCDEFCSTQMLLQFQELVKEVLRSQLLRYKNLHINEISFRELDAISQELYAIKDKLEKSSNLGVSLHEKLNTLKSLDSKLAEFIDKHDVYRKIKFLEITDKFLGKEDGYFLDISITQMFVIGLQEINSVFYEIQVKKEALVDKSTQDLLAENAGKYDRQIEHFQSELENLRERNDVLRQRSDHIALGVEVNLQLDFMRIESKVDYQRTSTF